ncbi:hypothetical protein C5S53_04475 [Methanophagales archaeon]|nr:hypothetical protein C5S53_04475 [Methanophagales archaeon]
MSIKEGFEKLFVKKVGSTNEGDYLDLDIEEYEADMKDEEGVKLYIKTSELTGLYDVPELKKEIYAGNILILDISLARQDRVLVEKAIKDLKLAAFDVGGDIAGIGDDQVIVAPEGIRIERKKLSGR